MVRAITLSTLALLALLALANAPSPEARGEQTISGRASVTDGDSLEIRGERIRLHGIDAVEARQQCRDREGRSWPCGRRAAFALEQAIDGRTVRCTVRDRDDYGRSVARCTAGDTDLGAAMVARGYAIVLRRYGRDYVPLEDRARADRVGIWDGSFERPGAWRASQRGRG
jgi:endonuclease YncB( thermonuclease family)